MVKSVLSSLRIADLQQELAKHGRAPHDDGLLQYHLALSYPISKSTLSVTGIHLRVSAPAAAALPLLAPLVLLVKAQVKGPAAEREYVLAAIPLAAPAPSLPLANLFTKLDLRVQMERIHFVFELRRAAAREVSPQRKRPREEDAQGGGDAAASDRQRPVSVDISVIGSISSLI
ncbi:hypothetical protein STCU_12017 [Strigomonas culicis]|uniref:Uncharacterized protein n=1 Tax=Strigomonas culicis TaxID=28005 RepID=S9UY30_9TRYP|nr:hypothetical protein STCU_12017 [Strigomonas culicis]|eukprot:EPY15450.1 hypothetical protein STCU_12017 [Strigomonas culicis]